MAPPGGQSPAVDGVVTTCSLHKISQYVGVGIWGLENKLIFGTENHRLYGANYQSLWENMLFRGSHLLLICSFLESGAHGSPSATFPRARSTLR